MKSMGDGLGRREKTKRGNLGLGKTYNGETPTSFTLVGKAQLTMNIYSTQRWYSREQDNSEGLLQSLLWWEIMPRGVWKKEIILTFQRYVILDAKRRQTGSVEVKIDPD